MKWRDFDYSDWKKANDKFDHETFDRHTKEILDDRSTKEILETSNELLGTTTKLLELNRPPFKPIAFYNKDGDILHIYISDDDSYAKWLCPGISIMISEKNGEVTGLEIEGLSNVDGIESIIDIFQKRQKNESTGSQIGYKNSR